MSFLEEGYSLPKKEFANNYLQKFEEGETRVRILASPKLGYEWWVDSEGHIREGKIQKGDKPIRRGMRETIPISAESVLKHFWAMPIYNYAEKSVQIMKITQYQIQSTLISLVDDEDWGTPLEYDIVIKRVGTGFNDTEYSVIPKPAKPLSSEVKEAAKSVFIDMDAWMRGEDPFKVSVSQELDSEQVAEDAYEALSK